MSDYPSDSDLEKIKQLAEDYKNPKALIDFVQDIWHFGDWGYKLKRGKNILNKGCWKWQLHTGGWSGNEEIIGIIKQSIFWILHWEKSIRGGHYWFEIPIERMKRNNARRTRVKETSPENHAPVEKVSGREGEQWLS